LNYKHYAPTILFLEQKFGLEGGRAQKRALAMTDISVTSQKPTVYKPVNNFTND
jgi:hypothetical protein